jgi:flavin reductase (DIM6/NTAB) family NADH-FMN oxidoreductase RutF
MHTFQPFPLEALDLNPFTKISTEWAIVAAGSKKKSNPMTISWGGLGYLWGKNVAFIFVRDSRYTKKLLDAGEFFSINFLSEQYRDALNYCGSHSGRDGDKFAAAGLTPNTRHGIPYADESNLVLLCEILSSTKITPESFVVPEIMKEWYPDGDMHTMYIAEIIEAMAR